MILMKDTICKRIGDIKERDKTLPKRDYEGEIKDLKQTIAKLKEENSKLKNTSVFPKVISKPADFDKDICKAEANVKLISVIYHIETFHTNVETKDNNGFTPLNNASFCGYIEIVKYLVEKVAKVTQRCIDDAFCEKLYGLAKKLWGDDIIAAAACIYGICISEKDLIYANSKEEMKKYLRHSFVFFSGLTFLYSYLKK